MMAYRIYKEKNIQRLKEGLGKFQQALEQDAKEATERGTGLPKNWRSKIFK